MDLGNGLVLESTCFSQVHGFAELQTAFQVEKSSRGLQHKFAGFGKENGAFSGDLMVDPQQFHSECKLPAI